MMAEAPTGIHKLPEEGMPTSCHIQKKLPEGNNNNSEQNRQAFGPRRVKPPVQVLDRVGLMDL